MPPKVHRFIGAAVPILESSTGMTFAIACNSCLNGAFGDTVLPAVSSGVNSGTFGRVGARFASSVAPVANV